MGCKVTLREPQPDDPIYKQGLRMYSVRFAGAQDAGHQDNTGGSRRARDTAGDYPYRAGARSARESGPGKVTRGGSENSPGAAARPASVTRIFPDIVMTWLALIFLI